MPAITTQASVQVTVGSPQTSQRFRGRKVLEAHGSGLALRRSSQAAPAGPSKPKISVQHSQKSRSVRGIARPASVAQNFGFPSQHPMAPRPPAYKRSTGSAKAAASDFAVPGDDDVSINVPSEKGALPPLTGAVLPAVAIACLGAFLFGYHISVVNGPLEYMAADLGFVGNTNIAGWVVSILLAGATVGSFAGGVLADRVGRTAAFRINTIPLIVGALLSATAGSVSMMMIGRFLAGIGIGVSSTLVPLYISEVSPTEIRGSLGAVNQLIICVGIFVALITGIPLASNPSWWRTMFALSMVPAALLFIGMSITPDSPRWLYKQGRTAEAESAVTRLWGPQRTAAAMEELRQTQKSGGGEDEEVAWGELFSQKHRKVVAIGAIMFFLQQFAGINAVIYYSSAVFRKVGITSDLAASSLVAFANIFGTSVASYLMDRAGRRPLLLGSYVGMAVSMGALSLSLAWPALGPYAKIVAITGTITYILSFSLGAGPVPGLLLSEMFASRIRAKAMSLALGVHWLCNFCIGLGFIAAVEVVGVKGVYLLFACVCLVAYAYINKAIVETKGKSLEEIEKMLA